MTVTIKYTKYQPAHSETITEKFCLVGFGIRENREYRWLDVNDEELKKETFKSYEEAMQGIFNQYKHYDDLDFIHFDCKERLVPKE